MMTSIVDEKLVSFKALKKKVFQYVFELDCENLQIMLKRYDKELTEERDKSGLRNKERCRQRETGRFTAGTVLWRLVTPGFHKQRQSANDSLTLKVLHSSTVMSFKSIPSVCIMSECSDQSPAIRAS